MRTYATNSPEAAGRVLALVLLADGHVCKSEIHSLSQYGAEARLGLPQGGLGIILRDLCEDLLAASQHGGSFGRIEDDVLDAMMREVTSPALQDKVLRLMHSAVRADAHLAEGEAVVIEAARRVWGDAVVPEELREALAA